MTVYVCQRQIGIFYNGSDSSTRHAFNENKELEKFVKLWDCWQSECCIYIALFRNFWVQKYFKTEYCYNNLFSQYNTKNQSLHWLWKCTISIARFARYFFWLHLFFRTFYASPKLASFLYWHLIGCSRFFSLETTATAILPLLSWQYPYHQLQLPSHR